LRPRWLALALRPHLVATIDQHLGNVIYINGIYHGKWIMSATAKLFMHGRSQAVRLPKEFRFEGSEVRVSKVGDKVILEPIAKQPIDFDKFWAELDALGARDFLPDGIPDDPPLEPDPRVFFDE
jgi:antitoxin VapB